MKEDTPSRMPWTDIYAGLAEKHGWLPEQVDRLTMYQALVYMGARDRDLATQRPTSAAELAAYARREGIKSNVI